MEVEKILEHVREIAKDLPRFSDGRINYTGCKEAAVISIFIKYDDKLLLLKRSDNVGTYKGKWSTVTGYLDKIEPPLKKALEEIREEIGIADTEFLEIIAGEPFDIVDESIGKIWFTCPFLAILKELPEITIEGEHTEYRWINPDELREYDLALDIDKAYEACATAGRE